MPISQGTTGPQTSADGTSPIQGFRQARTGEMIVSEIQSRYYEQVYRKNRYTARSALAATSLTGTALVGLILWNSSPQNGVNLVLSKLGGNIVASSATQTGVALAVGTAQATAPTAQTAVSATTNNFLGGSLGYGKPMNAGTVLTAPTVLIDLLHNTAAIATTGEDTGYSLDLEGSIIVPPQSFVAFVSLGAAGAAASNNHWLMWDEVPV